MHCGQNTEFLIIKAGVAQSKSYALELSTADSYTYVGRDPQCIEYNDRRLHTRTSTAMTYQGKWNFKQILYFYLFYSNCQNNAMCT